MKTVASGLSCRALQAAGQPISELMARSLANPSLISLAAGFVDQATLPLRPVEAAFERLRSNESRFRESLQYGTTLGLPRLRRLLCDRLAGRYGESTPSADRVLLTAGSNQLLHLLCEAMIDPGDIVFCAAPTYLVFLGALAYAGGVSESVLADDDGMCPEALDEALATADAEGRLPRVKAVYLVQYFDNPRGVTTAEHRLAALLRVVKKWSKHHTIRIIADVAYRRLRYDGDETPTLRNFDEEQDTVIIAGTFSKTLSPGLRVGFGILPEDLIGPVADLKGNIDFGSPCFNQHLVAEILESGDYDRHVDALCDSYRVKRDAMLAALEDSFQPDDGVRWAIPGGGLYVWLRLPEGLDAGPRGPLFDAAVEEGVLYVPGEYFYADHGQPRCNNTIRLSFGVQDPAGIGRGVAALARAVRGVTAKHC